MKRIAALLVAALATSAFAAPVVTGDDAFSLVPPDAAAVGMIRVADLRSSPLFDRIFADTDRISGDTDAARFLEEVRLNPKQDVDLVVVAGSPKGEAPGRGLAAFEGRFDAAKLAAATANRGGVMKSVPGGDYYLLPGHRHEGSSHESAAVAFLSNRLIVAGNETSVVQALGRRAAGGSGFAAGAGLGASLSLVDSKASAWALVDAARMPARGRRGDRAAHGGDASHAVVSAMSSVSLVALSATTDGDALKLTATGVCDDAETRQNLEDAVRGVLAMWRMSAQEKQPDLVPVLRRFSVTQGKDSVTLSGTLPGPVVRDLAAKKERASR